MHERLSRLPKIDKLVADPRLDRFRRRLGAEAMTRLARRAVDGARARVRSGGEPPSVDEMIDAVGRAAEAALGARARRVINATGVLLHTNLGRAPLSISTAEAIADSSQGYTSVELDLETGRRGARGAFAESALAQLAGAEAALVVNNNAAAVLLVLGALAQGRGVLVSRGELIEIGGGFRVPDVMMRSGARLIEVGTTNKTRLSDYEGALEGAEVVAILRVHQGNFRQTGFVERPLLRDLAALAHARGLPLIKDLGGGAIVDLSAYGLGGEPTARACIDAGADVVCFSTDKVLGGPQGGAIVGRAELVERARRDPLARAVRLGRLPLVALEATLTSYLEDRLDDIPTLRAIRTPLASVRERAAAWVKTLAARGIPSRVADLEMAVGGGALAEVPLPSVGIAIQSADPERLAHRLRVGEPPALTRIQGDEILLDARTVLPHEAEALIEAIAWAYRP